LWPDIHKTNPVLGNNIAPDSKRTIAWYRDRFIMLRETAGGA
jgi:hypothetical protein